jgi:ketosteroid isomerase-like protein
MSNSVSRSADVVLAWLTAVNAGDADAALALSAVDVAIVGPRGTGRGREVLRAWITNAGATFETRGIYAAGHAVVVEQHGVWRDTTTGAARGEAEVSTRFRVSDGQVAELERYDDLAIALRAAGLSPVDRVDDIT